MPRPWAMAVQTAENKDRSFEDFSSSYMMTSLVGITWCSRGTPDWDMWFVALRKFCMNRSTWAMRNKLLLTARIGLNCERSFHSSAVRQNCLRCFIAGSFSLCLGSIQPMVDHSQCCIPMGHHMANHLDGLHVLVLADSSKIFLKCTFVEDAFTQF